MRELVLRPRNSRQDGAGFVLSLREAGPVETGYTPLMWLPRDMALAISGAHTGIELMARPMPVMDDVEPKPIRIERVRDRGPGKRAWVLRVGEDLVTGILDGAVVARRLSDDGVRALQELAHVDFEPGEPDWALRDVEMQEDAALEAEEQAARLRAAAEAERSRWQAARDAELPAP